MSATKDRSIAQRLTWMNMLVSSVALVLACVAFIGYDQLTFIMARVSNLSTQAQIISSNSITALTFDDPESAVKTLSALKADPITCPPGHFTPAANGKSFATYLRPGSGSIPALPSIPQGTARGPLDPEQ